MKATHLRKNLFSVLNKAAHTGKPVEVESKGRRFRIIALEQPDKLANLQKHPDVFSGDLDNLIKIEWMNGWRP
jgi:prevent-host-death family protein